MSKGIGYNLIMLVLIITMGVFLGGQVFAGSSLATPSQPETEQNGDTDSNNESIDMPTGGFTPPSQSASEFRRIEFGFEVLKDGAGFYSESSQEIRSMGQLQEIFTKTYRSGDYDLMEEWQYSSSSMAKNEFVLFYNDGASVNFKKITDKGKFKTSPFSYESAFAGTQQTFSSGEFESKYNNFNNFPVTVNNQTATIISFDKRSDPQNYKIKVRLNPSKADQTYINFFKFNGSDNVVFSEIVIDFKISKTTGFFTEIKRVETFKTTFSGLSISCESTSTQTFKSINVAQKEKLLQIANANFAS